MFSTNENQITNIENVLNGSIDLAKIKNNHLVKQHLIYSLIKDYLFIEHLTNQQVQNLKEFLIFCGRDFFTQYIFEVFRAKDVSQENKFNASLTKLQIEDTFIFINNNPEIKNKFIEQYGNDFKNKINNKSYFEITNGELPHSYLFKKMYTILKTPELSLVWSQLSNIVNSRQ